MESETIANTPKSATLGWRLLVGWARLGIVCFARLLTGGRALWMHSGPNANQTVYYANHTSHADFVLLWSTLPPDLRLRTRPVAGRDYWGLTVLRRFVGCEVFHALLIERQTGVPTTDPLEPMKSALSLGHSLIIFPEGTRNTSDAQLLAFKSGIYRLSQAYPQVQFVPVWIENLKRVLPKGALLPVPLACTVRYGQALAIEVGEDKAHFLTRARQALLDLRPVHDREGDALSDALDQEFSCS